MIVLKAIQDKKRNIESVSSTHTYSNKVVGFFYSFGEIGGQLSWYMINSYLTLFYTDIVSLSAAAISMIMLVARLLSAVVDPIAGLVVDRTNTKWGRFRPYLFMIPPFLAIFNIATFTVFPVKGMAKVVLCLALYIITGTLYSFISIAHQGLVNRLSSDSQVKTDFAAARQIGSSVIGIILSAAAMPLILFFSNSKQATNTGFFWATTIFSLLMIPFYFLCAWFCREVVGVKQPQIKVNTQKTEKKSIGESLNLLWKNKPLLIILFNTFFGAIAMMGRMSFLSYYVIYVVGSYALVSVVMTMLTIGQLIGTMFASTWAKYQDKKQILLIDTFVTILSLVGIYLFGSSSTWMLVLLTLLTGITNGVVNVISISMIVDSIDYGDWKYGVRDEAFPFAMVSSMVKLATAICGAGGILLLAATGYQAGAGQTESAKVGINALVNLLPTALYVLSILPVFFYKISRKLITKINSELKVRNNQ